MSTLEKLKQIPHLQLPIDFDASRLAEEVENMPEMVGYELPGEDRLEEEKNAYRKNWKGLGLIDFETDSTKGMLDARSYQGQPPPFEIQRTPWGQPIYLHTDLAPLMPYCMLIIDQLFHTPGRCRVTSIRSGGSLNWHSHCQFKTGNYNSHDEYNTAILHVPIVTNPEVKFGVTKYHHSEHGINPEWQHYGVGECWLFNSWHQHNVWNEGSQDRIHLMMYGSLDDFKLRPMIDKAVDDYNGTYIR